MNSFSKRELMEIYGDVDFRQEVRRFAANSRKFAAGHFGWEEELEPILSEVKKITVLRDPVDRVISHYLHFKRVGKPGEESLSELSFEAFLETPYASNWQCRRLGGGFYKPEVSDEECFKLALANVEGGFDFVGITERMEDSIAVFNKLLGMKIAIPGRHNVNPDKSAESELKEKYKSQILKANTLDQQLYEAAVKRLSSAC